MRRNERVDAARATEIAIKALGYIASEDDRLSRFMALTGVEPADIREAATQPAFLTGVLDYFLGFEPDLLEFAQAMEVPPETIAVARQVLAGPQEAW